MLLVQTAIPGTDSPPHAWGRQIAQHQRGDQGRFTPTRWGRHGHRFARDLMSRDLAEAIRTAYTTDVRQFLTYLEETTVTADSPEKITKADVTESISHLVEQSVSGVTRRRMLAALRSSYASRQARE